MRGEQSHKFLVGLKKIVLRQRGRLGPLEPLEYQILQRLRIDRRWPERKSVRVPAELRGSDAACEKVPCRSRPRLPVPREVRAPAPLAGISPGSTLPPGNSHCRLCVSSRRRWQTRIFESRRISAATTVSSGFLDFRAVSWGALTSILIYEKSGFGLSRLISSSLMAFCTIADSIFPSRNNSYSVASANESRIHFEKVAKRRAAFAAPKPVGSKRRKTPRRPPADEIGQRLEVIRRRHQHAVRIREALRKHTARAVFRPNAKGSSAPYRSRRCKAPCSS